MDELLTPEQRAFRARVRAVLDRGVAPKAPAIERGELPAYACFPALLEAGIFAGRLAREHGGSGLGHLEGVVVSIELARACTATAMAAGASGILCGNAIARTGTPAQKKRYLEGISRGQMIGAWGL